MKPDLRSIGWSEVRDRVGGNRALVHAAMLKQGSCTCTELAAAMGWDKTSVRPRVTELIDLYHAVPTGARRNGEYEFVALDTELAERLHQMQQGLTLV